MPTSPRTASQALAWADQHTSWSVGMCLSYVRQAWGLPSYYGRAIDAWNGAARKHPANPADPPPPGAPVFYKGGASGHIVLNQPPTRLIRSTDCPSTGRVSDTDYTWPVNTWGYPVLGWTEDLNQIDLVFDTAGDDDMPLTQQDRDDIANIVTSVLRAEGVNGAGDAAHMLQAGYTAGITSAVTDVLRSEGVAGAADPAVNGTQQILAVLEE